MEPVKEISNEERLRALCDKSDPYRYVSYWCFYTGSYIATRRLLQLPNNYFATDWVLTASSMLAMIGVVSLMIICIRIGYKLGGIKRLIFGSSEYAGFSKSFTFRPKLFFKPLIATIIIIELLFWFLS